MYNEKINWQDMANNDTVQKLRYSGADLPRTIHVFVSEMVYYPVRQPPRLVIIIHVIHIMYNMR